MEYPKTYEYISQRLSNLYIDSVKFDHFSDAEKREMTALYLDEASHDLDLYSILSMDQGLLNCIVKFITLPKSTSQKKIWEVNCYRLSDELYFSLYSKIKYELYDIFSQSVEDFKTKHKHMRQFISSRRENKKLLHCLSDERKIEINNEGTQSHERQTQ